MNAPKVQVLQRARARDAHAGDRAERGVAVAAGALVYNVERARSPTRLGIQPGDVIVQINRTPITTRARTPRARSTTTPGVDRSALVVEREGQIYVDRFR